MIIVAGHLKIQPGKREAFLESSLPAMVQARRTPGCRDFVVSADPLEADRVNIYEAWDSKAQLEAFRGSGPSDAMTALIVAASVGQHELP